MLTLSGRLVLPTPSVHIDGGFEVPTLRDIARGLGRMPRFAGQTRGWWSVLHHSLVVEYLARLDLGSSKLRLLALLHDAHESATGDIPTPWKSAEMREVQHALDERLFAELGVSAIATTSAVANVALLDRRALLAEAHEVGPMHLLDLMNERPDPEALGAVKYVQAFLPFEKDTIREGALGVTHFENLVLDLLRQVRPTIPH